MNGIHDIKKMRKNKRIGLLREKRAKKYLEIWFRWTVNKSNLAEDKYHYIDFICYNSKGEKIFVQVKGSNWLSKEPSEKAIAYAKKHNAMLYYVYVPPTYFSNVRLRRIRYEEQEN